MEHNPLTNLLMMMVAVETDAPSAAEKLAAITVKNKAAKNRHRQQSTKRGDGNSGSNDNNISGKQAQTTINYKWLRQWRWQQ